MDRHPQQDSSQQLWTGHAGEEERRPAWWCVFVRVFHLFWHLAFGSSVIGLTVFMLPSSLVLAVPAGLSEKPKTITSLCFNIITPSNRALDDVSNRWWTWKNRPVLWKFSRQLSGCLFIPSVVTRNQHLPPQFVYPKSYTIWISLELRISSISSNHRMCKTWKHLVQCVLCSNLEARWGQQESVSGTGKHIKAWSVIYCIWQFNIQLKLHWSIVCKYSGYYELTHIQTVFNSIFPLFVYLLILNLIFDI